MRTKLSHAGGRGSYGDHQRCNHCARIPAVLLATSYTRPERHVDVLIADNEMPGMKGTDLAQQATERWPHLRGLLVSGGAADVGRVRATGVYQITQLLPSEEDTFRYRSKNPNEP